jgi:hypothetical protein
MNARTAPFACLLAVVMATPAAAASTQALTAAAFVAACTAAATSDRPPAILAAAGTLAVKSKYPIKLFKLNVTPPPDLDISVQIQKGPDTDVEIPRITVICMPDPSQATTKNGDIHFTPPKGGTATIAFHLIDLPHTTWKTPVPDSVWMVEFVNPGDYPDRKSWPKCLGTKKVNGLDGGKDMSFRMCVHPGGTVGPLAYVYSLHMDQTSKIDKATVDVSIDPQIINHPPS